MAYVCPVVVMDDQKEELINVAYGLSTFGLPIVTHRVIDGDLEREPEQPYRGVRLLFTDLHILGPGQEKPEIYVGGLIRLIQKLIHPSSKYLIIFWSKYTHEVAEAWNLLKQRLPPELLPIDYKIIEKDLAKNAALTGEEDEEKAEPFIKELNLKIQDILDSVPQLTAFMDIEGYVSQAAAETTDKLLSVLPEESVSVADDISKILARMSQEAIGSSHAAAYPVKGLVNAFTPILQDYMERNSSNGLEGLKRFLNITNERPINLPNNELKPYLNNFFIHSEGENCTHLDRGAVIRLSDDYLTNEFLGAIGLFDADKGEDWREGICSEFHHGWKGSKDLPAGTQAKEALRPKDVYAIELSALCDHAQNKQRSHRYLLAIFDRTNDDSPFYKKTDRSNKSPVANDSIYSTPEITIDGERGRLLVSCRVFATKPYQSVISGQCITRLRKDIVDELSHHYATHMRRPGKIAFY